jgi:hypothetical protein
MGHHRAVGMVKRWLSNAVTCTNQPERSASVLAHITNWRHCTHGTFVRLVELDGVEHLWPDFNFFSATRELLSVATTGS